MKFLQQFCVILMITLAGELLYSLLPLPIPAGIYGLILLLVLLCARVIRLDQVEQAGSWLIEIMPVLFIASAAGLVESWGLLAEFLVPFLLIGTVGTWVVMAAAGKVTDAILDRKERRK